MVMLISAIIYTDLGLAPSGFISSPSISDVDEFGYYSIAGVPITSFIYLGFLAAGEEIEQPFGYDDVCGPRCFCGSRYSIITRTLLIWTCSTKVSFTSTSND